MHDSVKLFVIARDMHESGLSDRFVVSALEIAFKYEGVADLMVLWHEEDDSSERDEIIADIQELVDDCQLPSSTETVLEINLNDLDIIGKNIRDFKDQLLLVVTEYGGVAKLAKATGIPQPSLSRFFNTNAMPRRITLLKIQQVLGLKTIKVPVMKSQAR